MRGVAKFISAGESFPDRLNQRWREQFGSTVLDCYGCSETVFFVFGDRGANAPNGSVGRLTSGTVAELRALDNSGPVPDGTVGRLFIQHAFLAAGYSRSHDVHADRFTGDWFDTGDLFRHDANGYWTHCGRDDGLLKVAGQWVNLHEIELAARECDGVELCAGVVTPDHDGMARIALYVTGEADKAGALSADRLVNFLNDRLSPHKRPKWVRIVASMPRTSTGKILKSKLTLDWDGE